MSIGGIDRTVVRITLGAVTGAGAYAAPRATPFMVWTPSATARDLLSVACSAAPLTEPGTADRDF